MMFIPDSLKILKSPYRVSSFVFVLFLSAYFSLIFNLPFIFKSFTFIHNNADLFKSLLFLLSIVFFLFSVFTSLFSILSIKYIEKPIIIALILISSILSYSYSYYGLIFDSHSPIMSAFEQTSMQELSPFLTVSFILWFVFSGLIPAWIVYKIKIIRKSLPHEILLKLCGLMLYPIFYMAIILPMLVIYHPILRLSGLAARPPFQIIPMNFIENSYNYYKERICLSVPYKHIGLDAKALPIPAKDKNTLLVVVVGEAARAMNFSLNGYTRNTNPYTAKQRIISFSKVSSCGTSTHVSIPCLFSALNRQEFSNIKAEHQDNLLDILTRAGINVLWFDNNDAGDCQGICKNIETTLTHNYDEQLVGQLTNKVASLSKRDTLIILHLQGSHGPNYYAKYPDTFRRFIPDCRKNELLSCEHDSLINAYDNSILYTDYVVSQFIEVLKKNTDKWNTGLIYTSDHGESIGEKQLYGHCAPYLLAPREQTHIPFLIWASNELLESKKINWDCLQKTTASKRSHDNFFHSVLGLMDVSTEIYQNKLDVFKGCRVKQDEHDRS